MVTGNYKNRNCIKQQKKISGQQPNSKNKMFEVIAMTTYASLNLIGYCFNVGLEYFYYVYN